MIWMSWRQFRAQAVVAGASLAAIAIYLLVLGMQIRHTYDANLAVCRGQGGGCGSSMAELTDKYQSPLQILGALLLVLPGLVGMFWGAPLVARELEAGTHRLAWNQSVTRRRWLAVKLLFVGVFSMAATGLCSALLTWAASPYDLVAADRFNALMFGARNIAPVAYAAFGFVLGASFGLLLRRTLPAMALAILVFAAAQIATPALVRPHLRAPVAATHPMTVEVFKNLTFLGADADVEGLRIPDAWVVSTSKLLTSDGRPVDLNRYNGCISGAFDATAQCLADLDLHVQVTYQPGDRYWDFQWLESAIFLGLSVLLAGWSVWRVKRSLT